MFTPDPSDPFYELMQPPVNETPAQKTARQQRELDAQRRSDQIDEDIKQERAEAKKQRGVMKVLLLGQAGSGKSTALKNLRMKYAQAEWNEERNGWRAVVQLNLARSITTILQVVEAEIDGDWAPADAEDEQTSVGQDSSDDPDEGLKFTDWHQHLIIRLAPLLGVAGELMRRLGTGPDHVQAAVSPIFATPFDEPDMSSKRKLQEFSVRSWREVLNPGERHSQASERSTSFASDIPTLVIAGCKDDMKALWDDRAVRWALKRRKLQLPNSAGFFLDDLDRIATLDYQVTDNDIVRARLRTVGIQEYRLLIDDGRGQAQPGQIPGWEMRIFDVGGCRTLRRAWLPYFDNVNAIIFLAPVSVFDQRLEEDSKVNRLEDSILLWTAICSSELLAKTQLILFLNKCDLLRRKLKRGVRVNHYLTSYGDRPNEVKPVVTYFREKFTEIQKLHSPEPRRTYVYSTTADMEVTSAILSSVRDSVFRESISTSRLI